MGRLGWWPGHGRNQDSLGDGYGKEEIIQEGGTHGPQQKARTAKQDRRARHAQAKAESSTSRKEGRYQEADGEEGIQEGEVHLRTPQRIQESIQEETGQEKRRTQEGRCKNESREAKASRQEAGYQKAGDEEGR